MPYKDKAVQSAWQNAWMKRRRQAWLDENGPCIDCGSDIDLEVHHKDPAQKIDHKVWSWREERRLAELAKCVVKCKKCHQGQHHEEMRKPIVHGSINGYKGYKGYGCRCDKCTEAVKLYQREYIKRKKQELLV